MFRKTLLALTLAVVLAGPAYAQARPEERSEARAEQDLAAQWGMQVAAEKMVELTRWQIFLGIVTAFGLFATLAMNARAIELSRHALEQSSKTTRAHLRPFISTDGFEGGGDRTSADFWELGYFFKNYGQTVASNVYIRVNVWLSENTEDDPEWQTEKTWARLTDLAPGDRVGAAIVGDEWIASERQLVLEGACLIVATFVLSYDDTFGQNHTYRFGEFRWGDKLQYRRLALGFSLGDH